MVRTIAALGLACLGLMLWHQTLVEMIVMLILFFGATLALFEHYRELGAAPVGWLYLLAYGSVAVVSLLHPVVSLIVDYSGAADG